MSHLTITEQLHPLFVEFNFDVKVKQFVITLHCTKPNSLRSALSALAATFVLRTRVLAQLVSVDLLHFGCPAANLSTAIATEIP